MKEAISRKKDADRLMNINSTMKNQAKKVV